jgi:hypothetical protein
MPDQWYYGPRATRLGPFTAQQLKDLAAAGKIQQTDTIWKEGVEQGVPATRVKNLFPASQPQLQPAVPLPAAVPEPGPALSEKGSSVQDQAVPLAPTTPQSGEGEKPPSEPAQQDSSEPSNIGTADQAPAQDPADSSREAAPAAPEDSTLIPKAKAPGSQPKKGRALGGNGAIIVSQDGFTVYFRKKCTKCGYEDLSKSRMPIRSGTTRTGFFCPKCRKLRPVEILGVV